jgi:hypothetical protein
MIKNICQIPIKFKTENKSIFDLLKETGYFENPDSVTIELIEEYLNKNQNIIHDWLIYSQDKRTSSGWYIIEKDKSIIVGYLNNGKREKEKEFNDLVKACSVFIVNEINSIKNR